MSLLTLICFVLVVRALQPLCLAKCWPYAFIRPCKDLKYSKSNWLLNSQLREPIMGSCQSQGVDLGSLFCSWRRWRYALFLFWWPSVFEDSLKYQLFSSVAKSIVFAVQERLSLLALIHIHCLTYIDVKEVFDWSFSKEHPRQLDHLVHCWKIMMQRSCIKPANNTDF